MKSVLLLGSVLAFLLPSCISADTVWTKVGFTGGDITAMESFPSNPDIMLACVKNHGLYRSTNRGASWFKVTSGYSNDLSISEDDVAFAAGEEGILVSRDYGNQWTACYDSTAWKIIAYRDGIVAVDTKIAKDDYGYIYTPWKISYNNGATWQSWEGTEHTVSLLFNAKHEVYRSSMLEVYLTDPDDWKVWTSVKEPGTWWEPELEFGFSINDSTIFAYSRYIDYHPAGSQEGGVFISRDGGVTWPHYTDAFSVSSLELHGDTIFIGEVDGALSRATTSSEELTVIGEFGGEITAIDVSRFERGEIVVATKGGIYKTSDRGAHWRKSDTGINYPEIASIQVIPVGNGGERIIVSTGYNGVFYSNDNGEHWIWADPEVRTIPGLLKASVTEPRRIYAAEASIHYSDDNGESWKAISSYSDFPAFYYGWYGRSVSLDIDPHDAYRFTVIFSDHSLDHMRGIFFIDGHYMGINDYGIEKWEWKESQRLESSDMFRSQFSEDGSLIWVSKDWYRPPVDRLILATDSNGDIVHSITLPEQAGSHIWRIDGQQIYALAEQDGRFWTSPDLGNTWSSAEISLNSYIRYHTGEEPLGDIVLSPDKTMLYLLYPGNGVLASADSGQTWDSFNDGLDTELVYQLAFSPADPSVIYAATADGLYRLGGAPDIVRVEDNRNNPRAISVSQNYPNPFNASTVIDYSLNMSDAVRIELFDVTGRTVRTLADGFMAAGNHRIMIDGADLSSGMYFCRFIIGNAIETRRIVMMK